MTTDLASLAIQLEAHPNWPPLYLVDEGLDLSKPAWRGRIAQLVVDAGGLVDPHFRAEVLARDLLTLWAAQADIATLVESRREAIRSGQIDPTEAVTCRLAGLDWIG